MFLLYPFAISIASIGLAWFFGRALFGTAAGLLAAAMVALLPIELSMATLLVPDMIATFWANLGIFAVWSATRSEFGKRAFALGCTAGLCFGIAWLHKVSIAYLAPFVGIVLLVATRKQPRLGGSALAGVAIASLGVLAAESLAYLHWSGEAGFRVSSLSRNFAQTSIYWFVEGGRFGWEPGNYAAALFERLFISGPRTIFLSRAHAHLPLAALVIGVIALRTRDTRHAFCGLWFASLLLLFNFGTTSFEYYKPLILFQRYLYPLVLPALLLASGWLVSLRRGGMPSWRMPISRGAVALLVCIPLVRGYVAGISRELSRPPEIQAMRATAELLSPNDTIVTDERSARVLPLLWGYAETPFLSAFENDVSGLAPSADYLAGLRLVLLLRSSASSPRLACPFEG